MTVTRVVAFVRPVRKGEHGLVHGALTIHRTLCGTVLTRAYGMLPRQQAITCPTCATLLSGRKES